LPGIIIDNLWSLFLDRDGVISEKLEDDYVKTGMSLNLKRGHCKLLLAWEKYLDVYLL